MEKINYDKIFQNTVQNLDGKKRLLLHCCCAPCSVAVLERLADFFCVSLYFYNPNIDTEEEYFLRAGELEKIAPAFGVKEIIVEPYNPQEFLSAVKGLESEPEGGRRCLSCFGLRLEQAARYAQKKGYDYFSTTLTVSPHKNSAAVNEAGEVAAKDKGVRFLYADFKKREGYKRSGILSEKFGLYRQNYCGCEFSKRP